MGGEVIEARGRYFVRYKRSDLVHRENRMTVKIKLIENIE